MLRVITDADARAVDIAMALDVESLPTLTLSELRFLPAQPAVYFVILNHRVLYIGATVNLKVRWREHVERRILNRGGCVAWMVIDASMLRPVERAMIHEFAPPMNNHHTEVGRGVRGWGIGGAQRALRQFLIARESKD